MGQIGGGGALVVLLLVGGDQFLAAAAGRLVDVAAEVQLRAGEVGAFGLGDGEETGDQKAAAADARQPGQRADLLTLLEDVLGLFGEDGYEESVRVALGELCQDGEHVGVALVDGGDGDRAAQLFKGGGKGGDEAERIGVAVMDGGHVAQLELVVDEIGDGLGLVEVVAGGAVVAGVVVGAGAAAQVGGQRGRGGGGCDHHQAGLAEDG